MDSRACSDVSSNLLTFCYNGSYHSSLNICCFQRILVTFEKIEVDCESNDVLAVFNEDRSFKIFDHCSSLKNDSMAGNFVIAKAKYLLLRLETKSERMLSAVFDLFFLDDPNIPAVEPSEPTFIFEDLENQAQTTTQPPKMNGKCSAPARVCLD